MRYVLSSRSRTALIDFAARHALLAFDFDGTLAPIVDRPEEAALPPSTHYLLRELAQQQTCLILSGRSRVDAMRKLQGTGIAHVVGNHGAEPWEGTEALRSQVADWEQLLTRTLPQLPGLWIENKGLSLTVHYRQCRRKTEARSGISAAARCLEGACLMEGKQSVSFVSPGAPNKGTALRSEAQRLGFERTVYVGDERTDEDVFALQGDDPVVFSIRVGRSSRSRAAYFLRSQDEIDELLRVLLQVPREPTLLGSTSGTGRD